MSVRLTSVAEASQACQHGELTSWRPSAGPSAELRQERGMTQAELAARLSLGRTSITNLEKGQQSPPLSMLPEIASALGVDPLRLIANAIGDRGSGEAGSPRGEGA